MLFGLVNLKAFGKRHDLTDTLGREEKRRAATIQRSQRKMQFIAGRLLARRLLQQIDGGTDWTLTATPGTPVRIDGQPGLHLSISHTGPWVACVLADFPVGIDIEAIKPGRPVDEMAELFCSDQEQYALAQIVDERERLHRFYQLWTVKEAWLKQQESPLSLELMRALDTVPCPAGQANLFSLIDQQRNLVIALAAPPGKLGDAIIGTPAVMDLAVGPHYFLGRTNTLQSATQRTIQ